MSPDAVRALRNRLGLTQAQAATMVGVAARTWHSWEQHHTNPNARRPSGAALRMLQLLHAQTPPAKRRDQERDSLPT